MKSYTQRGGAVDAGSDDMRRIRNVVHAASAIEDTQERIDEIDNDIARLNDERRKLEAELAQDLEQLIDHVDELRRSS